MQAVAIFIVTKYLNYLGPITVHCVDKMGPWIDTETSSTVMGGTILGIKEMLKKREEKAKMQVSSPECRLTMFLPSAALTFQRILLAIGKRS